MTSAIHFCLLIPCYNDESGLLQSLQSIQYDASNFAVLIVDDGSTVALRMDILKSAVSHISNLYLIRLPQNEGITNALNAGLRWILANINTPYIARLDCRDTSHAQRFYKQVTFLNTHIQVGLVGTWCTFANESGTIRYTYTTPLQHDEILKAMHLRNVFIHPAVMFRAALVTKAGFYPHQFPYAEDYAFFWRLLQVAQGAVLDEVLTTCAITQHGLSLANRRMQLQSRKKVVQTFGGSRMLKGLGNIKLYILLLMPDALLLRLKRLSLAVSFCC